MKIDIRRMEPVAAEFGFRFTRKLAASKFCTRWDHPVVGLIITGAHPDDVASMRLFKKRMKEKIECLSMLD